MQKLNYRNIYLLIIAIISVAVTSVISSDYRLKSMGNMTWSVQDINSQLTLYQVVNNSAQLKDNDSTNWMIYRSESLNNWGKLKRTWDAYKNSFHFISFSGQKHLGDNKIFYGDIRYNWDYRNKVDFAIEKNPYGYDPFVFTDYTTGSILYRGPQVFVAFNHLVSKDFYWGVSLNYNINKGLKEISSEAEIISRSIETSLDLIYNISKNYKIGLSFSPYQIQDITKLVTQKDGLEPTVRRYRGEFEYRERVGTKDRTSDYDGYELKPQFAYNTDNLDHVTYFSYYYQWHKLYDGTLTRHYDGYFQAEHYGIHSITRAKISDNYNTNIFIKLKYQQYDDWAKEPKHNLLFSQDKDKIYEISFGGSSTLPGFASILSAIEFQYNYINLHQIDYLANIDRNAPVKNWIIKFGIEHEAKSNLHIRYGFNLEKYMEDKVWNYFQDYSGYNFTCGIGWQFYDYELDFAGNYRLKESIDEKYIRTGLNILIQLKQYIN